MVVFEGGINKHLQLEQSSFSSPLLRNPEFALVDWGVSRFGTVHFPIMINPFCDLD